MPELQNVEIVVEGLSFPEGPVAMADGSVLVVEMLGGRISKVGSDGTIQTVAEVGGGPNGQAIGPDGALYVCNSGRAASGSKEGGSIQRVDLSTGKSDTLYRVCDERPLTAPNDIVFDTTGNFYFTDYDDHGAIYYAEPEGSAIRRLLTDVPQPNGIGISPDGSILYWAQTGTRQVHRRRIAAPGDLVPSPGYNVRALFSESGVDRFSLLAGLPGNYELDSLAVDSSGAVCVGTLVDSGISEIDPDGNWIQHTLPATLADGMVTNLCFGAQDLTTAFITCSMTGRLLRCVWHRPGLPLAFNA